MAAPIISLDELKGIIRGRLIESGLSQNAFAPSIGASPQTLSRLLTDDEAEPGLEVLRTLGYEAVTVYRKRAK